jgi:hypothetical protein
MCRGSSRWEAVSSAARSRMDSLEAAAEVTAGAGRIFHRTVRLPAAAFGGVRKPSTRRRSLFDGLTFITARMEHQVFGADDLGTLQFPGKAAMDLARSPGRERRG